jgi:hypothetical protein
LLGDFNAKVGKEAIFKPTKEYESLHKINNNNGVRVINFATSKKWYSNILDVPLFRAADCNTDQYLVVENHT